MTAIKTFLKKRKVIGWSIILIVIPFLSTSGVVFTAAMYNIYHIGFSNDIHESPYFMNPPPLPKRDCTLTVMTFNIHMLWIEGEQRPERCEAIAKSLKSIDPDIVGFQEVFTSERSLLIEKLKRSTRLRYFQYFPSGLVGSGLLTASAYPLKEVYFQRYSKANPWYRFAEGDWWAGKGVSLSRIILPDNSIVSFYNTHMQAKYKGRRYLAIRSSQANELAEFINATQLKNSPSIVVGDFNANRRSEAYKIIMKKANLESLMNVSTGIDHICVTLSDQFTFNFISGLKISKYERLKLSDHPGFASTITVHNSKKIR